MVITALFCLGLRLSAFFSGSEIGFYRVSPLRLSIDADSGDRVAERLLKFVQQPGYFVATTLVGNNVANYITTLAIAMAATVLFGSSSGFVEIAGTVLLSPVIFIFGELIPKNLYYEAPHKLLRRDVKWFLLFYWLFFVISSPLVWLSKLFERIGRQEQNPAQFALGRKRLVQVLSEGHHEGLLTQVQNRLVHGMLSAAPQPVTQLMTDASRVVGVSEDAGREEILEFARKQGQPLVPVRGVQLDHGWRGYMRVAEISLHNREIEQDIRPLVEIDESASKLEALLSLRSAGEEYGAIRSEGRILGLVTEQRIVEDFFQSRQAIGS